ncbi:flavin-containing monooxygenase FMO GS-OX-like 2 [Stegodyphus dumicola]|uniref:flavin-containing monooxygenase FMO GS-OX-like 2 n=1 Tax=Stegodyphus dumicola TaxID=202533 RepID=UPI0015AA217B|nr:flavin-containing monooxygenase FMO GS-OX-like 2 [Stegodyphus dumicola]
MPDMLDWRQIRGSSRPGCSQPQYATQDLFFAIEYNSRKGNQKSFVIFTGGKTYECDAILLCTGYLYHYPFFHPKCKIEITDHKVSPLYMHLFHINYSTLAIWGVPKFIIPFSISDQQVKVFLKFLKGIVKLPSKEEMRAEAERDFSKRLKSGFKPRHAHVMQGDLQWEYDDKLSELGKIKPIPDVMRKLFKHVHSRRIQDGLNYKKLNYKIIDDRTFIEIA